MEGHEAKTVVELGFGVFVSEKPRILSLQVVDRLNSDLA